MEDTDQFLSELMELINRYIDEKVDIRFREKILQTDKNNEDERKEKKSSKGTILNELPEILSAQNIADYLSISRPRVYELFQIKNSSGGIPNFSIGATRRVVKIDFINWIEKLKAESL
ncbi:helix-turn-helix domain-containing protein [Paenibacillus sp. M2]|uniref:helix-turn-helix domain-containing protein n=1 Tax=Paenibacillus sp. M2 TaxID=3341793 RepID=UPI003989E790